MHALNDRLYRSRDERVLFGVCGGIAERLDVDPSLVRIVFALLVISAGAGIALYVIMAFVVPEEPDDIPVDSPGRPDDLAPPADSGAGDSGGVTSPARASMAAAPGAGEARPRTAASPSNQPMTRREKRRAMGTARQSRGPGRGGMVLGAILVMVGLWFLAGHYLPVIAEDFFGPVVLIGLGLLLLIGSRGKRNDGNARRPR